MSVTIMFRAADPSVSPGVAADLGSVVIRTDAANPGVFVKTSAATTGWTGVSGSVLADITSARSLVVSDDFTDTLTSTQTLASGGTIAVSTLVEANRVGVLIAGVTDNVGTADATSISRNNASAIFFGGGVVTFEVALRLVTLSDSVDDVVLIVGMHDATGNAEPTDGFYLEYDFNTHGDHNFRLCAARGGVRTKVATGIAATASATWQKVILTMNAAGTSGTVTVNGVEGSDAVTANIPVAAANACNVARLNFFKMIGVTLREVLYDYYRTTIDFTTVR